MLHAIIIALLTIIEKAEKPLHYSLCLKKNQLKEITPYTVEFSYSLHLNPNITLTVPPNNTKLNQPNEHEN